ncbi:hypothetical protein D3C73_1525700 [compost metagenome]
MQRNSQRADVNRIAAFATRVFRQFINVGLRVLLTVDGFDIPLTDLLVWGFMGQHHNAFVACLLQHRLQHFGVVWYHDDGVDIFGDQILNHLNLSRGVWR